VLVMSETVFSLLWVISAMLNVFKFHEYGKATIWHYVMAIAFAPVISASFLIKQFLFTKWT